MKFDLKENMIKNLQDSSIIEAYAIVYSQVLDVDLELAKKIIQKKLERHTDTVNEKLMGSIENEVFKNIKPNQDVNVEEYLDRKPVIKG